MQRLLSRSNFKSLIDKLEARFQNLQTREKRLVIAGGCALLSFIFYTGFFSPLLEANANLRTTIPTLQKQLAALQAFDRDLKKTSGTFPQAEKVTSPVALLATLQKGLTEQGLFSESTRLKQVNHDAISVHLSAAAFDKIMAWLLAAQKEQALRIGQLTVRADTAPGTVEADIILNF